MNIVECLKSLIKIPTCYKSITNPTMAFLIHTAYYSAARGFQMEGWELHKIYKSMFRVYRVNSEFKAFSADKTAIR